MYAPESVAGDGRSHDVADAEDECPGLAGQLHGGQRVGRLARLRHGDHDVVSIDDRVAVAEFRSILHLHGDPAYILDQVLADQRRMPRCPARHEYDAAGREEFPAVVDHARQLHLVRVGAYAPADTVYDGLGLLVYLLEHEMRVTALFQLRDAHLQLLDIDPALVVVERDDLEVLMAVDDGNLAVVHIDEILRVFDDRSGVRAEEKFPLADANGHRAALARGDDFVAVALLDHGDGIGAHDLPQGLLHGFEQRTAARGADVLDQVHEHLGIGAAAERVAVLLERVLEHPVILDDAVVYQCDVLRFGVMRMGVHVVRHAVRRPARMRDADASAQLLALEEMLQVGDLALTLVYIERTVLADHGDPRAVVSAVFEPVQTLQQNRAGLAPPDISYNPTHSFSKFLSCQK